MNKGRIKQQDQTVPHHQQLLQSCNMGSLSNTSAESTMVRTAVPRAVQGRDFNLKK